MNEETCREFEEWLVDYADGELPLDEYERIGHHIKQCARCRTTVDALRESIRIAEGIWLGNLEDRQAIDGHPGSGVRWRRWGIAAAAACLLLGIGGAILWPLFRKPIQAPLTLTEIEYRVAQSAIAARLLVATDLLRSQANVRDVAEAQYRHILRQYPDTEAAAEVRLRLKSTQ